MRISRCAPPSPTCPQRSYLVINTVVEEEVRTNKQVSTVSLCKRVWNLGKEGADPLLSIRYLGKVEVQTNK